MSWNGSVSASASKRSSGGIAYGNGSGYTWVNAAKYKRMIFTISGSRSYSNSSSEQSRAELSYTIYRVGAENRTSPLNTFRTSSYSVPNSDSSGGRTDSIDLTDENGWLYITVNCRAGAWGGGSGISLSGSLIQIDKPAITNQPTTVSAIDTTKVNFYIETSNATGYQWKYYDSESGSWKDIENATSSIYSETVTHESGKDR